MNDRTIDLTTHPKMLEHTAIKKLTNAFSKPLQQNFCYGSITDDKRLIFYFKHPLHVNEFNMQKDDIKQKMREIYKQERLMGLIFFKDIDARSKFDMSPKTKNTDISLKYDERSKGVFTNNAKSKTLFEAFEMIREAIKERQ